MVSFNLREGRGEDEERRGVVSSGGADGVGYVYGGGGSGRDALGFQVFFVMLVVGGSKRELKLGVSRLALVLVVDLKRS